jgi:DnaJ-class molecular chaperone
MSQEFPAGSRWRNRHNKATVLVYGEAGGHVSYRTAKSETPFVRSVESFRANFERIEHPEAPPCPKCKGDGWAIPKSQFDDGVRCTTCGGRGHV